MSKKADLFSKLDAGRATAQAIAAPAATAPTATWPPKKPRGRKPRDIADISAGPSRVQFLVRLTPEARKRIKHAAWAARISEQEFIERFALTLG